MSVDILYDPEKRKACFFDDTTGVAFGPVADSQDLLERFQQWIKDEYAYDDVRMLDDRQLLALYDTYVPIYEKELAHG